MASKIYTKTGDKGRTALFGGGKVSKDDIRVEAYGSVDELNAQLGMLTDLIEWEEEKKFLLQIQNELFNMGSYLASDVSMLQYLSPLKDSLLKEVEDAIDRMQGSLPELKNFILPGGHIQVSQCHVVRTVCRRAERRIVSLDDDAPEKENILKLINRLSDYFFVLARYIGSRLEIEEIIWNA